MQIHWIWFATRKGISNHRKQQILQQFRGPEDLYFARKQDFSHVEDLKKEELEALLDKDLEPAAKIRRDCDELGIGILAYSDSMYPERLRNIDDPPMVLYVKGQFPVLEGRPVIGVVGTRSATAYGLSAARKLGAEITAGGGLVISGGATGIDTQALEGALHQEKPCMAILAGGLDRVYPKENLPMFRKISARGCLLSEYPPGTASVKWNFLRRNRLISAISDGILVVEAPAKSGALNTANWAMEQGKDLFVVPGTMDNPACAGSNGLISEGAHPVFCGWDLLREYASVYPGQVVEKTVDSRQLSPLPLAQKPEPEKPITPKTDKKDIDNKNKSTYSVLNNDLSALEPEERALVELLGPEPVLIDTVLERAGLPTAKALTVLTKLAMKGVVQNHPGRRVSRK